MYNIAQHSVRVTFGQVWYITHVAIISLFSDGICHNFLYYSTSLHFTWQAVELATPKKDRDDIKRKGDLGENVLWKNQTSKISWDCPLHTLYNFFFDDLPWRRHVAFTSKFNRQKYCEATTMKKTDVQYICTCWCLGKFLKPVIGLEQMIVPLKASTAYYYYCFSGSSASLSPRGVNPTAAWETLKGEDL